MRFLSGNAYVNALQLTLCSIAASIPLNISHAHALLVTTTSGFSNPIVTTNFDPIPANTFSSGPLTFLTSNGDEVRFTSTHSSVINYSNGYGFAANGGWTAPLLMAGLDDPDGYMDFTFLGGPVSAVGGFLNWVPGESAGDMYIEALDGLGNVLESYDLNFLTDGTTNSGAFYYIQRNIAEITTLRLGDSFVGIAEFTYDKAPADVPAPLPIFGAAAAYGYSRKLRNRIKGTQSLPVSSSID